MRAGAVLDSSALIAWLFDEPGKKAVSTAMEKGCLITTVNWCEVVQKANTYEVSTERLYQELREQQILSTALTIVDFPEALANDAAAIFPMTKPYGLSLGDRACLALTREQNLPVLTTDTVWPKAASALKVDVQMIR